jgi:hypothetical protein
MATSLPPKNPARVHPLLVQHDSIGALPTGGGSSITIVKTVDGGALSAADMEAIMVDRTTEVIVEDGLYKDRQGNRFQFRRGHVLPRGRLRELTRVGDFPKPEPVPGAREFADTISPPGAESVSAFVEAPAWYRKLAEQAEKEGTTVPERLPGETQKDFATRVEAEAKTAQEAEGKQAPPREDKRDPEPENK